MARDDWQQKLIKDILAAGGTFVRRSANSHMIYRLGPEQITLNRIGPRADPHLMHIETRKVMAAIARHHSREHERPDIMPVDEPWVLSLIKEIRQLGGSFKTNSADGGRRFKLPGGQTVSLPKRGQRDPAVAQSVIREVRLVLDRVRIASMQKADGLSRVASESEPVAPVPAIEETPGVLPVPVVLPVSPPPTAIYPKVPGADGLIPCCVGDCVYGHRLPQAIARHRQAIHGIAGTHPGSVAKQARRRASQPSDIPVKRPPRELTSLRPENIELPKSIGHEIRSLFETITNALVAAAEHVDGMYTELRSVRRERDDLRDRFNRVESQVAQMHAALNPRGPGTG